MGMKDRMRTPHMCNQNPRVDNRKKGGGVIMEEKKWAPDERKLTSRTNKKYT